MSDLVAGGAVTSESVSATAKLGQDLVGAAEQFGGWLAKTLGDVPADIVGYVGGDALHHVRMRNLQRLQVKTDRLLAEISEDRKTGVSPSIAIPIIESAINESRDELQEMWAALMANGSIDGGKRVRSTFIEAVRKLDAADAILLQALADCELAARGRGLGATFDLVVAASAKGLNEVDVRISSDVLLKAGLASRITIGSPNIEMTAFGAGLVAAITVT